MPIYEYACAACGHHFEKLQKMSEAVLQDCPECQQPKLEQLISSTAFQLKGDGWFKSTSKPADSGAVCDPKPATGGCGSCGKDAPHSH